jgi:hypothetical protein
LIGGRGSGKTTAIAVDVIDHSFHNAGAKSYILRKTQDSNEDTTLETFELVFARCGTGYQDTGVSLFKKMDGGRTFRLPSRKAIELFNDFKHKNPGASKSQTIQWLDSVGNQYCSWLCFAGVPSENYQASRFRGFECSRLIFVEADQLMKSDYDMALACLRWKGADPFTCDEKGYIVDSGIIIDSNPPSPSHWIAKLEDEWKKEGWSDTHYWHIPTHENRHNLPTGYVETLERAYAKNPALFQKMLLGQYSDVFEGNPVFFSFSQEHSFDHLDWPEGAYLIRGWDFGTHNAIVWAAYWEDGIDEYWWDLYESVASQSDVERQCRRAVDITNSVFPFWNDRNICRGVKDFCDIAGSARTDKGRSIDTLHSYQIFPGYCRSGLQDSFTIVNRLFEEKDRFGNLVYRIDKSACPTLYAALCGAYRYPEPGQPGYGSDEPLKGPLCGEVDHVSDAARYAKINCLRITKTKVEGSKGLVGPLARTVKVNRPRRYR